MPAARARGVGPAGAVQADAVDPRAVLRPTVVADRPLPRAELELRVPGTQQRYRHLEQPDLEREGREALAECRVVLCRENGGRDEHRDLLAILGRLERGAQRDLGLAETDIATDKLGGSWCDCVYLQLHSTGYSRWC